MTTKARRKLKRDMKGKSKASSHPRRITDFFPPARGRVRGDQHGDRAQGSHSEHSRTRRRELPTGSSDQYG